MLLCNHNFKPPYLQLHRRGFRDIHHSLQLAGLMMIFSCLTGGAQLAVDPIPITHLNSRCVQDVERADTGTTKHPPLVTR